MRLRFVKGPYTYGLLMAYYSGLVVTCAPGAMDAVLAALKSSKTAEVHQTDPATGRIVVVIEDDSVHGEADKFQRLRTMEGVADVSLIVHRSDEESAEDALPVSAVIKELD